MLYNPFQESNMNKQIHFNIPTYYVYNNFFEHNKDQDDNILNGKVQKNMDNIRTRKFKDNFLEFRF